MEVDFIPLEEGDLELSENSPSIIDRLSVVKQDSKADSILGKRARQPNEKGTDILCVSLFYIATLMQMLL